MRQQMESLRLSRYFWHILQQKIQSEMSSWQWSCSGITSIRIDSCIFCRRGIDLLKIPVVLVSYTSSVIPIVISVYALSKLEKGLKKNRADSMQNLLTPLLSLAIMVPATYLVIGPIADTVGKSTGFRIYRTGGIESDYCRGTAWS